MGIWTLQENPDKTIERRGNILILATASIFLALLVLQFPKHFDGKLQIIESGCAKQQYENAKLVDVKSMDLKSTNTSFEVCEDEDFTQFATFDHTGKTFKGLKIILSGVAVNHDLLEVIDCKVKGIEDWQTARAQSSFSRYIFTLPATFVGKTLSVKIACKGKNGGFFFSRSGSGNLCLTINSLRKRDCEPISIDRKFVLVQRERPRFQ